jgi:hypothetical protein
MHARDHVLMDPFKLLTATGPQSLAAPGQLGHKTTGGLMSLDAGAYRTCAAIARPPLL